LGKSSITDIYHPPELARRIKKMLYGPEYGGAGCINGCDVEVIGAGGKMIPIRLSATLILDQGLELGSVGFFHDLTARKRLEDELRRRSITDSLTGLYNRRQFHTVLANEVGRSSRYGRPMSLAIFDLDHFKPFNDNYGHQEGDNILRLVADTMRENLRSLDHAFRIGGDEFALVLVETDLEHGALAVERFRRSFRRNWDMHMAYLGGSLDPVAMSLGIAQLAESEEADMLIKRADLAMYEAKKDGGDRVILARAEIKSD
jgi:diguanylate cyclase (GGDEF)-like protein